MKILVTGAAGFLGSELAFRLAERGNMVIGLDNLDDSYDIRLKLNGLKHCGIESGTGRFIDGSVRHSTVFPNYSFIRMDLADRGQIAQLFLTEKFDAVINLAAHSGAAGSMADPYSFVDSNLSGFTNILEGCRNSEVSHLFYASSSDLNDMPENLHAATRKAGELLAYAYSKSYGLHTTGIRIPEMDNTWETIDASQLAEALESLIVIEMETENQDSEVPWNIIVLEAGTFI